MTKKAQSSEWIFWISRVLFTLAIFVTVFVFAVQYVDVRIAAQRTENVVLAQQMQSLFIKDYEVNAQMLAQKDGCISQIMVLPHMGVRVRLVYPEQLSKRITVQDWYGNKDVYDLLQVQSQAKFWKKSLAQTTTTIPVQVYGRDSSLSIDVLQES